MLNKMSSNCTVENVKPIMVRIENEYFNQGKIICPLKNLNKKVGKDFEKIPIHVIEETGTHYMIQMNTDSQKIFLGQIEFAIKTILKDFGFSNDDSKKIFGDIKEGKFNIGNEKKLKDIHKTSFLNSMYIGLINAINHYVGREEDAINIYKSSNQYKERLVKDIFLPLANV